MKTSVEPANRFERLLEIRPGVWIFVIATLLVCAVFSLFSLNRDKSPAAVPAVVETEGVWQSKPNKANNGRSSRQVTAQFTVEQAREFGRRIANEQAREMYGCEPFSGEAALDFVNGRWQWSACRGQGLVDFEANVEFGADGSDSLVFIHVLDIRADRN